MKVQRTIVDLKAIVKKQTKQTELLGGNICQCLLSIYINIIFYI